MKNFFTSVILLFVLACSKEPLPPESVIEIDNGSEEIVIIEDDFNETPLVIAGSSQKNLIVSFERTLPDSTLLSFTSTEQALPILMVDNEGNSWDVFGEAISGPRKGTFLKHTRSCMGYWFSFNSLYPGADIYNGVPVELPDEGPVTATPGWSIPTDYVLNLLGFGVIPSVDNPPFISTPDAVNHSDFYVKDNHLIVGCQFDSERKVYPHAVLDWHEVINDRIGETDVSILYCPLTGTTQVWKQELDGMPTTFGVSGLVYNNNLMPSDTETQSIFTQLNGRGVQGASTGLKVTTFPFVETTWSTWKEMYSDALIIPEETGLDRNYRTYPYGDYRTNNDYMAYPVAYEDDRILSRERVHGIIINNQAKVYQFSNF